MSERKCMVSHCRRPAIQIDSPFYAEYIVCDRHVVELWDRG
jgi:hypothetical protein